MPSGSVRRVSRQDIQLVQNLIERCLQLYMNQREVVDTLLDQAKIEPDFTSLVWQKLEEENQEFFKAYYLRLMVKHQILEFNRLLQQQVQLMRQMHPSGVSPIPASNGSHISSLHQNSSCYAQEHVGPGLKPENMHHAVGLSNAFTNGGSSMHTGMHNTVDISAHAGRIDAPQNMLSTQNSNMGLLQGINGGMVKSEVGGMIKSEVSGIIKPEVAGVIKSEVGYSSTSPYIFGADSNVLESRPNIGDGSVAPFSSVDSNSQALNVSLLDADTSSFGFLGQIPRNFSLSDLTADFSQSSDILESYSRSPFLAPDADDFLDSREREHQGDNKRLDTISEGLSYEDFGSDSL
ncbi:histidine-tRNA ligase [Parasponia andersonii]|uniref:Histidine-tRNA ligase n=1 Tax=Parasponia andersonii TaxID=3476 RepID=A0A2P5DP32_PARAD|nr:histidine-tRNA ligase [Parasponia andersonii]